MLKSISVKNLAIIKEIDIEWTEGLNILTGETGAGKSILFDALSIALGSKVNASYIRKGASKATIEVVFDLTGEVSGWLKKQELLDGEETDLLISREITKSSSRSRINGTLVNHKILKELRSLILTFHAQHEIRTLMNHSTQLDLLDGIAPREHINLKNKYCETYVRYNEILEKLNSLQISEEERTRRLDFAKFQFNELNEAQLDSEFEEEELLEQQKVLGNHQEIESSIQLSLNYLNGTGDTDGQSVVDHLQSSLSLISNITEFDSSLKSVIELLESSLANAEEANQNLRRYLDSCQSDPESLQLVEERLNVLATVKRKYGPSLKEAISRKEELEKELFELENQDYEIGKLKTALQEVESEARKLAGQLSKSRKKIAASLEKSILFELKDLGMERARFVIEFSQLEDILQSGFDRIEFTISTNPGIDPMPISKVASGGELSRVMLALKTIFARQDKVQTVVFDEIDAGMSGKTLNAIREKLARLARSHQILSITHHPIVASVADNHVEVSKVQTKNETTIHVSNLNKQERLDSIAQMASGDSNQKESMSFARSLLDQANELKSKLK